MLLDWQIRALSDLRTTTLSYQELADKYGRDRNTLIKLKREHQITRPSGHRNGPKPAVELKQLSPAHRALGLRITAYRGVRSYTELGEELNVTRHVVRMMEIGAHDFTLRQLQKLSEVMGRSITELITPHRQT